MGTLLALFSENKSRFFACAAKRELTPDGLRRVLASRYRYCIGAEFFYMPAEQDGLEENDKLCWVRDRQFLSLAALNNAYGREEFKDAEVRMGNTYVKRRRESEGRFIEVENFVAESLYEGLSQNPDALSAVSKDDFESLCAEIFVRRGFEVDLFRRSKDGAIDFLAVRNDDLDPAIFAVQCKQPDVREGKPRKSLGRPTVQQIYGAAKAWD